MPGFAVVRPVRYLTPRSTFVPRTKSRPTIAGHLPLRAEVHQVIGPPCSGKTTYVAERAKPGDLIVDWDALMAAISGSAGHSRHPALIGYVAEARDAIIARLRQRRAGQEPQSAWIISSQVANIGLPAVIHTMEAAMDECLRRLHADPDGRDTVESERAIRRWHNADVPG